MANFIKFHIVWPWNVSYLSATGLSLRFSHSALFSLKNMTNTFFYKLFAGSITSFLILNLKRRLNISIWITNKKESQKVGLTGVTLVASLKHDFIIHIQANREPVLQLKESETGDVCGPLIISNYLRMVLKGYWYFSHIYRTMKFVLLFCPIFTNIPSPV